MRTAVILTALLLAGATSANAYDCAPAIHDRAKAEMTLAFGTKTLQNDNSGGGGLSVLINDRFWRSMTFKEKQGFCRPPRVRDSWRRQGPFTFHAALGHDRETCRRVQHGHVDGAVRNRGAAPR